MAVDKTKNAQILLTIPLELLDEVENYWHDKKLKSRNAGILDLIQESLDSYKSKEPTV